MKPENSENEAFQSSSETPQIPPFSQARVMVFGDLMLDRYWFGHTDRISPEAPVPVVSVQRAQARPGGAANVAINIAALAARVELFGLVGDDSEADELHQLLTEQNVICHFQKLTQMTTTTKLRVLGQNQQLMRLDFEKACPQIDCESLISDYEKELATTHVVVLSDYAKGALQHAKRLIALASEAGVPVLVDPKTDNFACYRGATVITPNKKEFIAVVGECKTEAELIEKALQQIQQHDLQALLITLGKDGMVLVQRNGDVLKLQAQAREVYDVTGAGDTVIGVMSAALATGASLTQAATLANIAAGLVVRKLGAATITEAELRHQLQKTNDIHATVVTETELLGLIKQAKMHNQKIVFTNGCFDVLHAGHVQYLQQAKQLGDRLIVAVNSDESVRELKGPSRPLNSLEARMEVLAGLRAVDWVVSFSEATPERLITRLLPDVLVKGADYKVEQIAGHESVLKNGGEVKTVPLKSGFSTTNLVTKIKGG